jgi:hypothetical protein
VAIHDVLPIALEVSGAPQVVGVVFEVPPAAFYKVRVCTVQRRTQALELLEIRYQLSALFCRCSIGTVQHTCWKLVYGVPKPI